MLADQLDYVVGVDTHLDEHVLAVVAAPTGAVVARQTVRANARGYQAALRFAGEAANGTRAWAVEGTGSYGAGLARYLAGRGESVLELSRTPRSERRLRGKDDSLDAIRTARAALASETHALPRSGEQREALRLLLIARRGAVDVRREALVQLRSVIVTAPDPLREQLRGLPAGRLLERCRSLRRSSSARPDELANSARLAQPRPPNRSGQQRSRRARARDPRARPRARAGAARRARRRPDRRRPAARRLVAPRPCPLRGRLRATRRRRPGPRLERPDEPAAAEPRRRPAAEPGSTYGRPPPPPARSADQGLHRPTHRRGQESPRGDPLPQTPARARRLQHTQSEPSLDIGATLAHSLLAARNKASVDSKRSQFANFAIPAAVCPRAAGN